MAEPEISLEDARTLYEGTLCLHKGTPVLVESLNMERCKVFLLEHRHSIMVPFSLKDFSAPRNRIGFVNHNNRAIYVTRQPYRQWSSGVSQRTLSMKRIKNDMQERQAIEDIRTLKVTCLHSAILNKYPTLSEALKRAVESSGVWAFDKQFCIDKDRNVYYKSDLVGCLPGRYRTKERIQFNKGYEYLSIALIQDYEKSQRTFGA